MLECALSEAASFHFVGGVAGFFPPPLGGVAGGVQGAQVAQRSAADEVPPAVSGGSPARFASHCSA